MGRRETKIGSGGGRRLSPWISAAGIACAFGADYLLFRLALDRNYFGWYIAHGANVALLLTVFSIAVELDDEPNLVAADPSDYVGAWLAFLGKGFLWLSNVVDEARPTKRAESLDSPITALFAVIWLVAAFAWMLIIVPALYFTTFVCGAPIRQTKATTSEILVTETPSGSDGADSQKTFNIGLNVKNKPVSATNAIAAALLYGLSFAV